MSWLKQRRQHLKLSQEDLTARLQNAGISVTRATLSHWETGRYKMPVVDARFRRVLASELRMSEVEILQEEGFKLDTVYSAEALRAAEIVERLSPNDRQLALRLLEQLDGAHQ